MSPPHVPTGTAAQFAPFAALEGYEEAVAETSRYVEEKPEFSEEQRQELDRIWQDVCRRGLEHSRLRITYFQEDLRKRGGTWRTEIIQCRKIDRDRRYLITQDGQKISLDCICQVSPE